MGFGSGHMFRMFRRVFLGWFWGRGVGVVVSWKICSKKQDTKLSCIILNLIMEYYSKIHHVSSGRSYQRIIIVNYGCMMCYRLFATYIFLGSFLLLHLWHLKWPQSNKLDNPAMHLLTPRPGEPEPNYMKGNVFVLKQ